VKLQSGPVMIDAIDIGKGAKPVARNVAIRIQSDARYFVMKAVIWAFQSRKFLLAS
jgi:hypothetical protein